MEEAKFIFTSIDNNINRLCTEVVAIKYTQLRIGSSVVILCKCKIGVITEMSKTHVKVNIDDEETIISKRQTEVQKLNNLQFQFYLT